jgi:D-proline reductase (dithiol) PrdB
MADNMIIANVSQMPVFEFENPAFTKAPPLKEATVAIVTTAGLRHPDTDGSWNPDDPAFRVFDRTDRGMTIGHLSPNFDRSGFVEDINVIYPIDRLEEMAAEGVIKDVGAHHISFMGAQGDHTMGTLRMDTAPAAAKLLKEDGVDVVLLTPV